MPRVSAHSCSAISNFSEGSSAEQLFPYLNQVSEKLGVLMKNGISLQKEHSVTALATTIVQIKEKFDPYFGETIDLLLECLNTHLEPAYRQYRAQIIEAISLISSTVSKSVFMTKSDVIIQTMIIVQNSQMADNDPQKVYLLSAWQRICVIMQEEFAPYLDQIMPNILQISLLQPKLGIDGNEGDIEDMLKEIRTEDKDGNSKKININSDELEDKDTAIQMLVVFVEELGSGFAKYIEQTSQILLSMTKFSSSANIRNSCVGGLPSLIKAAKDAQPDNSAAIHTLAKMFCNNVLEAMDMESETECLTNQTEAVKEIMEAAGNNLMQPESVQEFYKKIFEFVYQSEARCNDTRRQEKEELEAEEDERLDDEDMAVFKDEIKEENELQVALVELVGILFKTHKQYCAPLAEKIITEVLPSLTSSDDKNKQKLLIYLIDDMIEFLGPEFLT